MDRNPLLELKALGQSVWLDDLRRAWLEDGTLKRLIRGDGLDGVTSNPAIFAKAMIDGEEYEEAIAALKAEGAEAREIYDALTLDDVGRAADLFRPVYDGSRGADGYVSIEVSPHLAMDAGATIEEAKRLWERLGRPNVMIKVPGTRPGLEAIAALLALGVNVNVTLLFSVARYREVVEAFLGGLERRAANGEPVEHVASVASFFLSRIDSLVDPRLDRIGTDQAGALRGQTAIASARLAYRYFGEWTADPRWRALADRGARPQRLLWASTSTKDPIYSDVKYVEALVAPDTVNTMPRSTLAAYRDHGHPEVRIAQDLELAESVEARLRDLGIDLAEVAETLEAEGVRKFIEPWDALLAYLGQPVT
ncbi:MAG TPA: transaldolase [Woeseiaceae bacterium]|nr:transaldolase [Woeseiaceae bacterium]